MTMPAADIAKRDGCARKSVQRREARVTAIARQLWPTWPYAEDREFPFDRRPYRRSEA